MTKTVSYTTKKCMFCGKSKKIDLPEDGFNKWKSGEFVQVAFPGLSADTRELLITGVDSKCWNDNMVDED